MYILRWFVLETLFLASITATKSIFYLVGFLAPWFLTKISSKNGKPQESEDFSYLRATISLFCRLPATTSTYHYLPLPATTCH